MKKIIMVVLVTITMLILQACTPNDASSEFAFVSDFNLFEVGDGYANSSIVELSSKQQSKLKKILDTDSWKTFTGEHDSELGTTLILSNKDNDCIYFGSYENETLILVKYFDKPNEGKLYSASIDLMDQLILFQEELRN